MASISSRHGFVFGFSCVRLEEYNDNGMVGVPPLVIFMVYFVFFFFLLFLGVGRERVALCAAPP